jgi:hypothetical protein
MNQGMQEVCGRVPIDAAYQAITWEILGSRGSQVQKWRGKVWGVFMVIIGKRWAFRMSLGLISAKRNRNPGR